MTFEQLPRTMVRLADLVYDQIFDAIVLGNLLPGERLVQETLGEQMQVSRTPVRDALVRLESEGILEASDRGGFLVRSLDRHEVTDLYHVRAAIEGYSAGVAAELGSPEKVAAIEQAIENASVGSPTLEEGFEFNRRIHRSIVAAADNSMLLDTFDSVWGRSQSFRMFARLHEAEMSFIHAQPDHGSVLAAIKAGDPRQAKEAMEAHVLSGLELQLAVIKDKFET
jgi:DNA-binding GntR family transcriptional regulator